MTYTAPVQNVTAATYLEIVNVFRSILAWRGHVDAMGQSMHHAAVMVGEVDEPTEVPAYNPMATAGYFGIMAAMDTLMNSLNRPHVKPDATAINAAHPVATQLLFALLNDQDALAVTVRQMRTRFIGHVEDADAERVPALVAYLRKLTKFSDDFAQRAAAGDWNSALTRRVYSAGGQSYVANLPIEHIVESERE
jgi:hypothetical protein